jgi:hypothetical protein
MSVAKVNQELAQCGQQWHQFEIAAGANSAADLAEAQRLQKELAALLTQLYALNIALHEQIRALSNPTK